MEASEVKRLDRLHILHSWAVNASIEPKVIDDAQGVYLIDADGNRMLDLSSQLKCVNAGYKNPAIIQAIQEQAEKLCFISPSFAYESRSLLGQRLAEVTPGDLNRFFFTLGGAEANENAVKMARMYTKKHKILAFYRSYHGATYGAISLTGDPRRPAVEPGIPGVVHLLNPYCYRCPFGLVHPQCGLQCAEHVAEVIAYETPETIAAFILEPIVGSGGVIIPPEGYMKRVKEICEANDILLIADEVMTGFGRSGQWFAMEHWDVVPDLMTMAKGLTSAYVPLGGVALSNKIAEELEKEMLYCGLTYSCHPLSCATAHAVLGVYQQEGLVENSRNLGKVLKAELEQMQQRHPCVGDVRGLGLFACMELVKNRETKTPLVPYNAKGEAAALTKKISGMLVSKGVIAPLRWMFLPITPPLCITEDELKQGLAVVDEVLADVDTMVEK